MKAALIMLLTLLSVYPADAQDYGTAQIDTLIAVIDGDTFRADIAGWPPIVGENVKVRVRGVDSPEIRNSAREKDVGPQGEVVYGAFALDRADY